MTFPRELRDLLMAVASLSSWPCTPDWSTFSDPAKSTSTRCPARLLTDSAPPFGLTAPFTFRMKTECDREDWAFILVAATLRLLRAASRSPSTSSMPFTGWTDRPGTHGPPKAPPKDALLSRPRPAAFGGATASLAKSLFSSGPPRRSRTCSLYTSRWEDSISKVQPCSCAMEADASKSRAMLLGMIPCASADDAPPSIVHVLPEPVCP
mmetsp:Transcript_16921/g.39080  ORF Transcript_16921/g.39080 Transcript_16921/m.39080 type:complete len:209 (+) Transcript_16921:400-1026(+)